MEDIMKIKMTVLLFFVLGSLVYGRDSQVEKHSNIVVQLAAAINADKHDDMFALYSDKLKGTFNEKKSKAFMKSVRDSLGKMKIIRSPIYMASNVSIFPYRFERGIIDIRIAVDSSGKLDEMRLLPRTPGFNVYGNHKRKLMLPMRDRWLVEWGGDCKELNKVHIDIPNQKNGYDLYQVNKEDKTYKNKGKENKDYYSWAQKVYCPAEGEVIQVITGVPDNIPGSRNSFSALGNAVFIKHKDNSVSVFAHLKFGSIDVEVEDELDPGDFIALCGNSGDSKQPHLSYQLMDKGVIQDAKGKKSFFDKVIVTRNKKTELVKEYSPVKGDIINPKKVK
jgi:hypothetical protein